MVLGEKPGFLTKFVFEVFYDDVKARGGKLEVRCLRGV
jgi:hypothetical protein